MESIDLYSKNRRTMNVRDTSGDNFPESAPGPGGSDVPMERFGQHVGQGAR